MSYLSTYSFFKKNLSYCEAGKEKYVLCLYCLFTSASTILSWTITLHEYLFFFLDDFNGVSFSSPALQNRVSGPVFVMLTMMDPFQLIELVLINI